MFHLLSSLYDPSFDQLGRTLREISVCSEMLAEEWKKDLLKNFANAGIDAVWHEISLANFRALEDSLSKGDTVWILIDGIEIDGYPGATVISYVEELQRKYDLRVIGPRRGFYCQDKRSQKKLLMENRIETPAWFLPEDENAALACFRFLFQTGGVPCIIKPFHLYCSVGIGSDSVVDNEKDALRVYSQLLARTPNILIEEFIVGREFTVVCIGNPDGILVYPPVERLFHKALPGMGFMDFSMTQIIHGDRSTIEMAPVEDPDLVSRIEGLSRATFTAIGAESYVRIDIRLDTRSGLLHILEVNACPSVGLESSIEEVLNLSGVSFDRFIRDVLTHGSSTRPAGLPRTDNIFFDSACVILRRDPDKGRCVQTKTPVRKGDPLFFADIEAFGVEEAYKRNYCHHCLKFSGKAYVLLCESCGQVYYCSEKCRDLDIRHKTECTPLRRFYEDLAEPAESISYYRTAIQVLSHFPDRAGKPLYQLVTNYDTMATAKRIEAWRIAIKLQKLFDQKISLSNILAVVCSTDCNCFSSDYDPDGITLLSSGFAMIEHCCLPNAARKVEGKRVVIFAIKDMPAGHPVTISYISALYHRSVRRQNFAEYYSFECGCSLCRSASDEIPREDLDLISEYYRPHSPERLRHSSCYSFLNGRVVSHEAEEDQAYPSDVKENFYGKGLFASADLPSNRRVEKFLGAILPYSQVPEDEKTYALLLKKDEWLVATTPARFINHSCDPNCRLAPNLEVLTVRPVKRGDELTISYNRLRREEYLESPESYFWDPKWTFSCHCGSSACAGLINCYVFSD